MTEREKRKIESLENNISETENLMNEWEEKKRLSENPTERKKSELEIARLRKILGEYESELNLLKTTAENPIPTLNKEPEDSLPSKTALETLIQKNKVREALKMLLQLKSDDDELRNWVSMQLGRLSQIENDRDLGILGNESYTTELSKIRQAILRKSEGI